ncbi:MAG: DUF721 domain-containing protein [Pseudomonadota bacterium]
MKHSKSKSLTKWLQTPSEQLSPLLTQVRLLHRLTGVLRGVMGSPLAEHCQAANLDGATLVISTDSPVWAAKLRYQLTTLLTQLQARGDLPPIEQLRIRVLPANQVRPAPAARRLAISSEAAAVISHVAENTTDPQLQAALRRLARHAAKPRPEER